MSFGIGMGAGIVGGAIQDWAAHGAAMAQAQAAREQFNLQQKYRQQGMGTIIPAAIGWGADQANQDIAAGAAQRRGNYAGINAVPMGPTSGYAVGPSQADQAYAAILGNTRAQLGGYSDWLLNRSINDLKTQQALNQISSFAGGQAQSVYPYQLYDAQHSKDYLMQVGQAISALGGAMGTYNMAQNLKPPAQTAPLYFSQPDPGATSGALGGLNIGF